MNCTSLERERGGRLIFDMYILFSTTLLKGASVRRARKRYSCTHVHSQKHKMQAKDTWWT